MSSPLWWCRKLQAGARRLRWRNPRTVSISAEQQTRRTTSNNVDSKLRIVQASKVWDGGSDTCGTFRIDLIILTVCYSTVLYEYSTSVPLLSVL